MTETDEALRRMRLAEEGFERMSALYRSDPDAFEREARRKIDEVIERARPEHQARLRAMQSGIDRVLARYRDPVARMNKMVELFWNGVRTFEDAHRGKFPQRTEAIVISFPERKPPNIS